MPSVPQSLLWISLVVLWLFVLVPMLISKRDAVRRTSDVALATRVLNSGVSTRLRKRRPADGHRSDPDWQPVDEDDDLDDEPSSQAVVVKAAQPAPEQDIIDVDVVEEDSGALPVGASEPAEPDQEPETEAEPEPVSADEQPADSDDDGTSDEYEYVEDTSGLESEEESAGQEDTAHYVAASAIRIQDRGDGQRPQVPLPEASADGDVADPDRDDPRGGHRVARWVVGVRRRRDDHDPVPGLSPPADPHRGTGTTAADPADGARAGRCAQHR